MSGNFGQKVETGPPRRTVGRIFVSPNTRTPPAPCQEGPPGVGVDGDGEFLLNSTREPVRGGDALRSQGMVMSEETPHEDQESVRREKLLKIAALGLDP